MQEDEERFCFCGKKGAAQTTNWKFICGTWVYLLQVKLLPFWKRNIGDFYCVPHIFYFEKHFNLYFADASRISLLVSRLRGLMTRGHWRRKWRTDSRRDLGGTNQSRMDKYGITICCIHLSNNILLSPIILGIPRISMNKEYITINNKNFYSTHILFYLYYPGGTQTLYTLYAEFFLVLFFCCSFSVLQMSKNIGSFGHSSSISSSSVVSSSSSLFLSSWRWFDKRQN